MQVFLMMYFKCNLQIFLCAVNPYFCCVDVI